MVQLMNGITAAMNLSTNSTPNFTRGPPFVPDFCGSYTNDTGKIAYAVFLAVVMVLSILGNTLICIAIFLSPRLRETPTNHFIFSLSLSDMCYAIFQTPIRISTILHTNAFCHPASVCYMYVLTDLILTPATITTLFVIAIDRFFCITKPFIYQETMTKTKAKVIVCCVWAYAVIWSAMSTFQWNEPTKLSIHLKKVGVPRCFIENKYFYFTSYFLITLIPLVIMGILYVIILRVAIVQIRAIRATEVHFSNPESEKKDRKYAKISKSSRRTNRELKATATLAIVYGAFFVCWMPLSIINIYIAFGDRTAFARLKQNNEHLFLFIFYMFFEILPTLSTAINPLIYNVFNRQFRSAFVAVMLRLARRNDVLRRTTIVTELENSRMDHGGRTSAS
ncbi:beta-2 adrenergic receptor-like [Rhopilema esculentum]|uniref:beta-2 adrenergic receptor-like n=1 Tax=Rhopilema esculentum TaxID=499914 RepID=UPI0031D1C9C9